jgi:hypothetical protein
MPDRLRQRASPPTHMPASWEAAFTALMDTSDVAKMDVLNAA